MFAALRRCMEEREPCDLENEFTYLDGTTGWFELRMQPVPEGVFILSIDITNRKQAEKEIDLQLARLRSLRVIDLAILGTTDLNLSLKSVLEETTGRLQADAAVIFLFNQDTLMLEAAESLGFRNGSVGHMRIHLGDGVAGRAALERRTVAIPDLEVADFAPGSNPVFGEEEGIRALFAAPLVARGNLVGVIEVARRSHLDPDANWLDFLEILAGQAALAVDVGRSFEDLQRSHFELALAYDTTIEGWSRALDLRDKETEGHTQRVTEMTLRLACRAGMSEAELAHVRRGALLHDIGKMGVPDAILLKPGRLSDEEWVFMRRHPEYAYELLAPVAYLKPALEIPYCHHEKWDGSSYPRGLKGEQIPLSARLFAVVDVWDALRSDRPYREAWPDSRVHEHIRSQAGTHFDPMAV